MTELEKYKTLYEQSKQIISKLENELKAIKKKKNKIKVISIY